jgi:hypothetical protein
MNNQPAMVLRTVGCAALFMAVLGACGETPWFAFKPADGSFLASFPVEPTKAIRTVDTPMGQTDVTSYTSSEKQQTYTVTVADYPAEHIQEVGNPKFLDEARDAAVAATSGRLLSEKPFDLKGHPGREITIAMSGGKGSFRCRLILVGNRLFQVIVAGPADEADARPVKRFLDAFSVS